MAFKTMFESLFSTWLIKQLEVRFGLMEAEVVTRFSELALPFVASLAIVWFVYRFISSNLQREFAGAEEKQRLLDEIGGLRTRLVRFRIEMQRDINGSRSKAEWEADFHEIENAVASRIEAFASKAEAEIYLHRGTIQRVLAETIPHQRIIDIAVHDLEHLREFIKAYSRRHKDDRH